MIHENCTFTVFQSDRRGRQLEGGPRGLTTIESTLAPIHPSAVATSRGPSQPSSRGLGRGPVNDFDTSPETQPASVDQSTEILPKNNSTIGDKDNRKVVDGQRASGGHDGSGNDDTSTEHNPGVVSFLTGKPAIGVWQPGKHLRRQRGAKRLGPYDLSSSDTESRPLACSFNRP